MKKIGIMTDSHSGILTEEAEKLGIKVLPMPFYIDDELYLEGVDLSREEFYEKLRQGVNVSTFVPAPPVGVAVKLPSAFALFKWFPTILREPLSASDTLSEATAPVKLPA